jgi:hypothetical protein
MSRIYKDWLAAYMKYNEHTESAPVFHRWAGISTMAAVLRRKVNFNFGRIKVYPNLFIVLVAEPGVARKTQSISFAEDLLSGIYGIHLSADSVTPQALLEDLELAADSAVMSDGTQLRHSSLTIFSGEFESFLGQKKENSKMIVTLTDLYDCKARPFKYRTKHSGSNVVPLPYLNMMAATTPESLANCLPSIAIGGGLTSRIIFVWASGKHKKVAIPDYLVGHEDLQDNLIKDLSVIARLSGSYNFSEEGRAWWINFYNKYEERDPNRLCKDPAFAGWYSRKPIFMLKLGTILAASRCNEPWVEPKDFERGLTYLEEIESNMGSAFSAVGRSDVTADVDLVRKILERSNAISEKQLRRMVWRDIDDRKFSTVIDTIVKGGDARREFTDPAKQKKEIWYHWNGIKANW